MNTPLIGFLSPDGDFSPCRSYGHMNLATELIKKRYPKLIRAEGCRNEMTLLDNLGYAAFMARGCVFKGEMLSDEQRLFIVKHIEDALNDDQYKAIDWVLKIDTARRTERAVHEKKEN